MRRYQQRAVQPGSGRCVTCDRTAMPPVATKTNARIIIICFTIVPPLRKMGVIWLETKPRCGIVLKSAKTRVRRGLVGARTVSRHL